MITSIPFYANTKNDLRCTQAVLRMVLKSEGKSYTFTKLDRLTHRRANDWTWNAPVQLAMSKLGFSCLLYEDFNYQAFARKGRAYLEKTFGDEWTSTESKHTSLSDQARLAKQMLKKIGPPKPPATITDMRRLFKQGWYVAPTVNSAKLQNRSGYVNHVVLVTGMDEKTVTIHDPGSPPRPHWKISWSRFQQAFTGAMKAWGFEG